MGGTIVTDAVAALVGSAAEVAVTIMSAGLGTEAGALYKPPVVIVPHAAPLQLPEILAGGRRLAVHTQPHRRLGGVHANS